MPSRQSGIDSVEASGRITASCDSEEAADRVSTRSRLMILAARPGSDPGVMLAAAGGLRPGEIYRLRCSDIDVAASRLSVLDSKARRSRMLPLHPSTTDALAEHLHARDTAGADHDYLFVTATGAPFTSAVFARSSASSSTRWASPSLTVTARRASVTSATVSLSPPWPTGTTPESRSNPGFPSCPPTSVM